LLKEGTDLKYGARHLKRAIERHIVYPLASLLATEQVTLGDVISIGWERGETMLKFSKEVRGALVRTASATSRVPSERTPICEWPRLVTPSPAARAA
jgi:hypothetical protein